MKKAKLRVISGDYYINGKEIWVHPYNSNTIKQWVYEDIKKGNYRIGVIDNGSFKVCYIGRATGQPLQARMLQHPEYMNGAYYFDCNATDTDEEALKQECIDFHSFGEKEWLDNEYHPSLPEGEGCPWNGCRHVGG